MVLEFVKRICSWLTFVIEGRCSVVLEIVKVTSSRPTVLVEVSCGVEEQWKTFFRQT